MLEFKRKSALVGRLQIFQLPKDPQPSMVKLVENPRIPLWDPPADLPHRDRAFATSAGFQRNKKQKNTVFVVTVFWKVSSNQKKVKLYTQVEMPQSVVGTW